MQHLSSIEDIQNALHAQHYVAERGLAAAIVARDRKLAIMFYNVLRYGMVHAEQGLHRYAERHKQQMIRNGQRRTKALGLQAIVPNAEAVVWFISRSAAVPAKAAKNLSCIAIVLFA